MATVRNCIVHELFSQPLYEADIKQITYLLDNIEKEGFIKGNPNDKDRAVAMEFFQSEGGKQRGSGGRTRLAGSPYQNTITNEIMSLSKEIEDLAKQKRQYGNF